MKRSKPLRRKAPMKRNRAPIKRARIKPKARPAHTPEEQAHMDAVAELGCLACEMDGHPDTPACLHHVKRRKDGQKYGYGQRAPHKRVLPLCEGHHQGQVDPTKLAFHKNPTAFEARYGNENELLDLVDKKLEAKARQESIFPLALQPAG